MPPPAISRCRRPARWPGACSGRRATFPFFAAAVLAVVLTQRQDGLTALAVQLYFWARLIYLPLYAAGVPYVRSLVWLVSLLGIVMLLWALL